MKRACSICVVMLGSDTATLPEWAGGSGLPNTRAKGEWFWELMTSRPEAQPWSSVCLAVTKQILYLLGDPHWAGGGVGRGEGAAEFVMCVFSHENCAWKHNTTEEGDSARAVRLEKSLTVRTDRQTHIQTHTHTHCGDGNNHSPHSVLLLTWPQSCMLF